MPKDKPLTEEEIEDRRLAHEARVAADRIAAEAERAEEEPAVPVVQLTKEEIETRYQEHLRRVQEGR